MKLEVVVDRTSVPIGTAIGAPNVVEVDLVGPSVDSILPETRLPPGILLIEDTAIDGDPHREDTRANGIKIISPLRKIRVFPSRNDRRIIRRYKRRYIVVRNIPWFYLFRQQ